MSFYDDFRTFQSLNDDQFSKLIEYANSKSGENVKDYIFLEKLANEIQIENKDVLALNRIVGFLADYIIGEKSIEDGITAFEKDFVSFIEKDDVNKSWLRLKESILSNKLESYILFRKEQHLKKQYPHIHQFSLVCDLRPVFDFDRKKVNKYLYPILLKIVDHDDEVKLFELDEDDLHDLQKEVETAILKLNVLKENAKI